MAISTLVQAAKRYFEDHNAARVGKQIDEILFGTLDESSAATVQLDQYLGQGFAMSYTKIGQPAHVVPYTPGVGKEWEVLPIKRKTPIDETLADSAVAGVEPKAPQAQHMMQVMRHIIGGGKGFIAANKMMRIKMALDVFLEGKMINYDELGNSSEVDFGRDSSLTLTYDFNAVGATFDACLKQAYDANQVFGIPQGNLAVILGSSMLKQFMVDPTVKAKRLNTNASNYVMESIRPPLLQGVEGLFVVGLYHPDGMPFPVWILTYNPAWKYVGYSGATASAFVGANKMILFNLGGEGYRFNRGVQVLNGKGQIVRRVGDMVIDSFVDNDPPQDWFRATCRPFYALGNIDHTSVTTGSNFS